MENLEEEFKKFLELDKQIRGIKDQQEEILNSAGEKILKLVPENLKSFLKEIFDFESASEPPVGKGGRINFKAILKEEIKRTRIMDKPIVYGAQVLIATLKKCKFTSIGHLKKGLGKLKKSTKGVFSIEAGDENENSVVIQITLTNPILVPTK